MSKEQKRIPRCPGCSESLEAHEWGNAGKFCEGSPSETAATVKTESKTTDDVDSALLALEKEIEDLCVEEEKRKKEQQLTLLQTKVEKKKAALAKISSETAQEQPSTTTSPANLRELKTIGGKPNERACIYSS